jgi:hypothetical protein
MVYLFVWHLDLICETLLSVLSVLLVPSLTCPRFVVLQGSSFSSDDRAEQKIYLKRNLCPVGSMCSYQSPIS